MAKKDQHVRKMAIRTGFLDQSIDVFNTARMKEIVAQYGWPVPKLVGERVSYAAWILVQHADLDPQFQKRCLMLMRESQKRGHSSSLEKCIDQLYERVRNPLVS